MYPPQSLQPFTVADSLLRCGLASRASLQITTLDISPRVKRTCRAASQSAYRLVFPWNVDAGWTDEAAAYGSGRATVLGRHSRSTVATVPRGLRARGISVAPGILRRLARSRRASCRTGWCCRSASGSSRARVPRAPLLRHVRADVGGSGIADMLRPGGALLTNDAVLEVPEVPMRSGGYLTVRYLRP